MAVLTQDDIGSGQQRVLDVALARLVEDPQAGRIDVTVTELRFALSDLPDNERQRVIESCEPLLLRRTATSAGGGDQYAFTFNGILLVSDSKVVMVLNAVIAILKRDFRETKGAGSKLLSWTDVKNEPPRFAEEDFELARQAILASRLGAGGRRGLGDMATDPGFKFYAPGSQELELIAECEDVWELLAGRERQLAFDAMQHSLAAPAADMLYGSPASEQGRRSGENPRGTDREPEIVIPGYVVGAPIGQGGGGMVFEALEARPNGVKRAVKIIAPYPSASGNPQDPALRFGSEVDALYKLKHRAIVPYIIAGVTNSSKPLYYLVMDHVEGTTLRDASEAMGTEERIEAIIELLGGLHYAHEQGIFHRDVKASNVVVRFSDQQPVLVDFGLAYHVDGETGDDRTTSALGTLVPPEVVVDPKQSRSPKHDIYQVGMTLYELFARTLPNRDNYKPLAKFDTDLAGLDPIVNRAIGPAQNRYALAAAFIVELKTWLQKRRARSELSVSPTLSAVRQAVLKQDETRKKRTERERSRRERIREQLLAVDLEVVAVVSKAFADFVVEIGDLRDLEFDADFAQQPNWAHGLETICCVRYTDFDFSIVFARSNQPEKPLALREGHGDHVLYRRPMMRAPRRGDRHYVDMCWVIYTDDGARRKLQGGLAAADSGNALDVYGRLTQPLVVETTTRLGSPAAIRDYATSVLAATIGVH